MQTLKFKMFTLWSHRDVKSGTMIAPSRFFISSVLAAVAGSDAGSKGGGSAGADGKSGAKWAVAAGQEEVAAGRGPGRAAATLFLSP